MTWQDRIVATLKAPRETWQVHIQEKRTSAPSPVEAIIAERGLRVRFGQADQPLVPGLRPTRIELRLVNIPGVRAVLEEVLASNVLRWRILVKKENVSVAWALIHPYTLQIPVSSATENIILSASDFPDFLLESPVSFSAKVGRRTLAWYIGQFLMQLGVEGPFYLYTKKLLVDESGTVLTGSGLLSATIDASSFYRTEELAQSTFVRSAPPRPYGRGFRDLPFPRDFRPVGGEAEPLSWREVLESILVFAGAQLLQLPGTSVAVFSALDVETTGQLYRFSYNLDGSQSGSPSLFNPETTLSGELGHLREAGEIYLEPPLSRVSVREDAYASSLAITWSEMASRRGANLIEQRELQNLRAYSASCGLFGTATPLTDGFYRIAKTSGSCTAQEVLINRDASVAQGQTYTQRFLYRSDGPISFKISFFTGTHNLVTPTIRDLGGGIYEASASFQMPSGITNCRVFNLYDFVWGSATYIDVKDAEFFRGLPTAPEEAFVPPGFTAVEPDSTLSGRWLTSAYGQGGMTIIRAHITSTPHLLPSNPRYMVRRIGYVDAGFKQLYLAFEMALGKSAPSSSLPPLLLQTPTGAGYGWMPTGPTRGSYVHYFVRLVPASGNPYYLSIDRLRMQASWFQSAQVRATETVQQHTVQQKTDLGGQPLPGGALVSATVELLMDQFAGAETPESGFLEIGIFAPTVNPHDTSATYYGYLDVPEALTLGSRYFLIASGFPSAIEYVLEGSSPGYEQALSTTVGTDASRETARLYVANQRIRAVNFSSQTLPSSRLVARQLIRHRALPRKVVRRGFWTRLLDASALYAKRLLYGGSTYWVLELEIDPLAELASAVFFELAQNEERSSLDRFLGAAQRLVSRFYDSTDRASLIEAARMLAFARLAQALSAGSMPTELLLDAPLPIDRAVKAGDKIFVISPSGDRATFTVNTRPGGGDYLAGDVRIAVSTTVPLGVDFPVGSYVVPPSVPVGKLRAEHIDVENLFAQNITLNNGGIIKSANFLAGSTGWQIDYQGNAEFNSVIIRNATIVGSTVESSGNLLPAQDASYDIGSASKRWRSAYLSDLVQASRLSLRGSPSSYPGVALDVRGSQLNNRITISSGPLVQIANRDWGGSAGLLFSAYAASSYNNGALWENQNTLHAYGPSAFGFSDHRAKGIFAGHQNLVFAISSASPGAGQPVNWELKLEIWPSEIKTSVPLRPFSDGSIDLGASTLRWKDGYFSGVLEAGQLKATALSSGSVLFAGSGGMISQDAALVWDAANKRLGINIASPSYRLDVSGTLGVRGDATLYENVLSENFVSGFTGAGWKIGSDGSAEFAGLTVRGTLRAYELLLTQVKATNGALAVSDAARLRCSAKDNAYSTATFVLVHDKGQSAEFIPFETGDLILAQRFQWSSGSYTSIYRIVGRILGKSNTVPEAILLGVIDGFNQITVGEEYDFVRIGSSIFARQGLVYITASDPDSPYIDVIDGVNSLSDWGSPSKVKVRLGRLSGLTWNGQPLSGYGLFGENVYLTGSIKNTSGSWILRDDGSGQVASGIIQWDAAGVLRASGWYLETSRLRSASNEIILDSSAKEIKVAQGSGLVRLYWTGSGNWGLEGKNASGQEVFRLGSTNSIAGWSLTQNRLESGAVSLRSGSSAGLYLDDTYAKMHFGLAAPPSTSFDPVDKTAGRINNNGFEAGSLSGWSANVSGTDWQVGVASYVSRSGSYSAYVASGSSSGGNAVLYQRFSVGGSGPSLAGKTCLVRLYVYTPSGTVSIGGKTYSGSSSPQQLYAAAYADSNGTLTGDYVSKNIRSLNLGNWTLVELMLNVSSSATHITVVFGTVTGESSYKVFYFDDIQVFSYDTTVFWAWPDGLRIWAGPLKQIDLAGGSLQGSSVEADRLWIRLYDPNAPNPSAREDAAVLFFKNNTLYIRKPDGTTVSIA